MTFTIPSHLPRQVDVSSQILSKLDSVSLQSLDSTVASEWHAELDESIRLTKKRIHDRIHANLPAFEAQLASAKSAQQRLRGLATGMDALDRAVSDPESGLTPTLLEALKRHQSLAQASLNADVLHASLLRLSECKRQLEEVQQLVESGDLPAAVPASARLTQLLDTTPPPLGEASITLDIRSKLRVLTNRLEELLDNAYTQGVDVSPTDITIRPLVLVSNSRKPIPLYAVLSSLSPTSLSTHMSTLRRDIIAHYIDYSLDHPTSLLISQEPDQLGSFVHRMQRLPLSPEHGTTPLGNLSCILEFVSETLFPCLPQPQRETFPKTLVKPLTTSIMTRLLIPSLPANLVTLPAFLELTADAATFETKYVIGLLKGDNHEREISNWVENVCGHYEKGRRQRILDNVRETILASAARPRDTFSANFVTVIHVAPGVDPTFAVPAATDNLNLNDTHSIQMGWSSSDVNTEDAWGFDDDVGEPKEPSISKPGSLGESEPDPNEAWGWNDEPAEESPETNTPDFAETPPEEPTEEVWDDDPWADSSIAEVTLPDRSPLQPAPASSASSSRQQPLPNVHPPTNGHVANGHRDPLKPSQIANYVDKEPYPVSVLTRRIVQAIEDTLREGKAVASSGIFSKSSFPSTSAPGTLIMQSGPLVLDLYCALHPVVAALRLSQPVGRMQFSNDCHYLSEEMARVLQHEQGLPSVQARLEEHKDDLRVLSDCSFYQGVDKQIAALEETLGDADGFADTSNQERYDECEMVITRILRDVRGIAHAWKPILPKSKYYTATGLVVDGVLSRILDSILAISDITEVESHKLSELCRILTALEGLFVEDTSESSFVVSYVPSWLKFSYLSELLEASMADLTYLFEEGALVDFGIDELVMLVKALFADTPLRTKTIDKIMNGHPIR